MTVFRLISLPLQAAFELVLGLALATAPLAVGVPPAGVIAGVLAGTLIVGMALAKAVEPASLRSQYEADWALALALVGAGAGLGLAGEPAAMLAFGLAALVQLALNLVTRYSPTTS